MRVWIDQDLCTGDGICTEIAGDVFEMHSDGLAYVKAIGEKGLILAGDGIPVHRGATEPGGPKGLPDGLVDFPDSRLDAVIESAEECPGLCIFIEP